MNNPLKAGSALSPKISAPQQKPRPLPLFLEMVKRETSGNPERLARVLKGLRAYQEAPRSDPPVPMPVVTEAHGALLRDYGGDGPSVIFIPSLINPPTVLDLAEDRSLLRWLAQQGNHVLLLDWGWASVDRRNMNVEDHVTEIILPMMRGAVGPPHLVGYCLGGTMALAAAALAPVRSVATIAAPWHFRAYPPEARRMLGQLWQGAAASAATMGVLPMEVLQAAFWQLDPARTAAKYEAFSSLDPHSREAQAFVTLEDWANDGPPLPEAAAEQLIEGFFCQDLPGSGCWRIGRRSVDPAALPCPLLNIVSQTDRVVPPGSAIDAGRSIEIASGHVGMVVGRHAREQLWEPLFHWLKETHSARL